MSLSKGIELETWNAALRTSVALLTVEANGIDDVSLQDLLEDADKDAVIAVLAQQVGILVTTLPAANSERLLRAWSAASLGVEL